MEIIEALTRNLMPSKGENSISSKTLFYFEKALLILEPWKLQLALEKNKLTDNLDEEKVNELYTYLSRTENDLGSDYFNPLMPVGKERTDSIYEALTKKARRSLANFDIDGAKAA
jgi:hypothetical protein